MKTKYNKTKIERELTIALSLAMAVFMMIFSIFSLSIILPVMRNNVASIITSLMVMYMVFIYFYFILRKLKHI